MVMRLVRDEPDVQLDDALTGVSARDATVFTDLAYVREPPPPAAQLLPRPGPGRPFTVEP